WVWHECCALMRFNLNDTNLEVGPVGARSLVEPGEAWVIEMVLEKHALVIPCEEDEGPGDSITRELWHAACPMCGNRRLVACHRKVGRRRSAGQSGNGQDAQEPKSFDPKQYVYRPRPCPNCRSGGSMPRQYDDVYAFALPNRKERKR